MNQTQKVVVVDTSLALKWAIFETDTPLARALLQNWIKQKVVIIAPDLLIYEIANGLFKRISRKELTLEEADHAFDLLMATNLNFEAVASKELSIRALDFAYRYKLPATYDAHYLALAEREQCGEFWTADERLYNSLSEHCSWVRLMVDPPASTLPA